MDITCTLVGSGAGGRVDVVLTAGGATPVRDLQSLLGDAVGCDTTGARPRLYLGAEPIPADQALADSGIRDGCLIGVGAPAPAREADGTPAQADVLVRIVAGPDQGAVFPLPRGEALIGRSSRAAIRATDPLISREHARIDVEEDGIVLTDLGATNPSLIEGTELDGIADWPRAALLEAGDSLFAWDTGPECVPLTPTPDGGLAYNRPPRLLPPQRRAHVAFPSPPGESARPRLQLLAIAAPLLLSAGMALAFKQPQFLVFMLLSPVMLVSNYVSERRQATRLTRRRQAAHAQARAAAETDLAAALGAEKAARRAAAPDPAEISVIATRPTSRLWERRRRDPDALVLRLGLADLPAETEARGPEAPADATLHAVPVTVPLREVGVLGIAGDPDSRASLGRWLAAQAAVLHSPRDLAIVVLASSAEWPWLAWLPHARPRQGQDCLALVGNDEETLARRAAELSSLVAARLRTREDAREELIVVLDGARALRGLPGMPHVLQHGPEVGVYAICLDAQEIDLPEECQAVCTIDGRRLRLRRSLGQPIEGVLADHVTAAWAERAARALAPIRDISREDEDGGLPVSVRLLDLVGQDPPDAEAIRSRWLAGGHSTTAVVGVTADGPFTVDLRRDGPHALVAGTTGAGKSELLQTLVTSLALANQPDGMSFVLIDYKGGSAFKDCARLPHTVGMVTDLDAHQTERALTSLGAELKRREEVLSRAGAKDIDEYRASAGARPLPRLVLVIDEFASLAAELPDFIRGLIAIAQRGRSLGVHLVLATQRPSGVVSPEIRANTNLRIALRVTNEGESADVLGAPDAARVSRITPGRAFARVGHAQLIPFQTARAGSRRPPANGHEAPPAVHVLSWERLGRPLPRRAEAVAEADEGTDLSALVAAIGQAAAEMGQGRQPSPWLEALPERVLLGDLAAPPAGDGLASLPFALEDRPLRQDRQALAFELERGGHLLFVGSPRSGRSTALRSLAGALAERVSARDVHLYGLDCGNGALLPLTSLPHCGAVVTRDQVERADRLIARLLAESERRQRLFAEAGFTDLAEQRATERPLPYLVLMLDRWEGFLATFEDVDGGRLVGDLLRLLREAPAVGLRALISGDRSALTGRLTATIEDRFILRLSDRADYAIAGLNPRTLPEVIPPGRAFAVATGAESQVALLAEDASGPAQVAALRALASAASRRDAGLGSEELPAPVAVLPVRIDLGEVVWEAGRPLWALVGVGGDRLEPMGVDMAADGPGFLIAGPVRSGRSTALLVMARSLLASGCRVLLVAPRRSPLGELRDSEGVAGVLEGEDVSASAVGALVNGGGGPLAVLVDDAELLSAEGAGTALQAVLREARDRGHAVVVAGTASELGSFRGLAADVRKSRAGLLLSPDVAAGELLGLRLPRSATFTGPPGRGLLVSRTGHTLVQVPHP